MSSRGGGVWRFWEEGRIRAGQATGRGPGWGALKRVGVSWCQMGASAGEILDPVLPSATLSSHRPPPTVPTGASEFAESIVKAWSMEKGPHLC